MPFKGTPVCIKCGTKDSLMWTNAGNLGAVCLDCLNTVEQAKPQRKTRTTCSYKTRSPSAPSTSRYKMPKGKGRRSLFKSNPFRAPSPTATPITSEAVYNKGVYWQVGDIVSLLDEDDDLFYGQIRGFLTDQYCEKSACITWLLPSTLSPTPTTGFDPATYVLGPEEDLPRKLECMQFIMHAPSDYYRDRTTPYPPALPSGKAGCLWTSLPSVSHK